MHRDLPRVRRVKMLFAFYCRVECFGASSRAFIYSPVVLLCMVNPFISSREFLLGGVAMFLQADVRPKIPVDVSPAVCKSTMSVL